MVFQNLIYKHKARRGEIPQNFSQLTAEAKAGISSCAYQRTCFAYQYTGTERFKKKEECIGQKAADVKSEPRGEEGGSKSAFGFDTGHSE